MRHVFRRLRPGTFLRSVGVLASGAAAGNLITLAAAPVLSRLFEPGDFGTLAVYTAVLGIAIAVGSLRLEQAIGIPRSQQVAFNVMVLAVLTAAVAAATVGIVGLLAPHWLFPSADADVPAVVVWLLPIGILFGSLYQALTIWALRSRAYRPIAGTRIRQGLATALAQTGAGLLGLGPVGLTAGHALGQTVGAGTLISRTVRRQELRRPRRRELKAALSRYRRFPLFATPAALLNSVSLQVPVFALASAFGAAVTGQYFLSARITLAPIDLIGRSVGQVFYAEAVSLGRRQPVALRRLVLVTSAKSFLIGLAPGLLIAFYAPAAFTLLLGPAWEQAGQFSQALAIMLMANFALAPVEQVFFIVEKQTYSLITNSVRIAVALAATLIPISVGAPPVKVMLVYSLAMALYYVGVLCAAVVLLTAMAASNEQKEP